MATVASMYILNKLEKLEDELNEKHAESVQTLQEKTFGVAVKADSKIEASHKAFDEIKSELKNRIEVLLLSGTDNSSPLRQDELAEIKYLQATLRQLNFKRLEQLTELQAIAACNGNLALSIVGYSKHYSLEELIDSDLSDVERKMTIAVMNNDKDTPNFERLIQKRMTLYQEKIDNIEKRIAIVKSKAGEKPNDLASELIEKLEKEAKELKKKQKDFSSSMNPSYFPPPSLGRYATPPALNQSTQDSNTQDSSSISIPGKKTVNPDTNDAKKFLKPSNIATMIHGSMKFNNWNGITTVAIRLAELIIPLFFRAKSMFQNSESSSKGKTQAITSDTLSKNNKFTTWGEITKVAVKTTETMFKFFSGANARKTESKDVLSESQANKHRPNA